MKAVSTGATGRWNAVFAVLYFANTSVLALHEGILWVYMLRKINLMSWMPDRLSCRPSFLTGGPNLFLYGPALLNCKAALLHCRPRLLNRGPTIIWCGPDLLSDRHTLIFYRKGFLSFGAGFLCWCALALLSYVTIHHSFGPTIIRFGPTLLSRVTDLLNGGKTLLLETHMNYLYWSASPRFLMRGIPSPMLNGCRDRQMKNT